MCFVKRLFLTKFQNKANKKQAGYLVWLDQRLEHFSQDAPTPDGYTDVLDMVRRYVEADGYFFYVLDKSKGQYKLESVLYKEEENARGKLVVGYSRLISYYKEAYDPPLYLPVSSETSGPSMIKEGRHSLLHIPMKDISCFIRVLTPAQRRMVKDPILIRMAERLEKTLKTWEANPISLEESSNRDNIFFIEDDHEQNSMSLLLLVSGSNAGIFFKIVNNYCERTVPAGFEINVENRLRSDEKLVVKVDSIAAPGVTMVDFHSKDFRQIPDYLIFTYTTYLFLRNEYGILVLCYKTSPANSCLKDYRLGFMKLLMMKLSEGSGIYGRKTEKQIYLKRLKDIAGQIDSMIPKTVGYSELMSGYTAVLCRETGVDPDTAALYEQGAYLSNIGFVALPEELWNKKGLCTREEYRSIQNHAFYGAEIVLTLIGDSVIEQCIRYHHEQPDGKGYPKGLKGNDIPEGARILGVVHHFLSKFKGRVYWNSIPFDQVLNGLKKQAGTSLDPLLTNALIGWLERKQVNSVYKRDEKS